MLRLKLWPIKVHKDLTYGKSDWTQTVLNISSIYVIFVENVRSVVLVLRPPKGF